MADRPIPFSPAMMADKLPGFWMNETSGVLRPAIETYLDGGNLPPEQVVTMRAYLRQWIDAPGWLGPEVEQLRSEIDGLTSHSAIKNWINQASELGIDPL